MASSIITFSRFIGPRLSLRTPLARYPRARLFSVAPPSPSAPPPPQSLSARLKALSKEYGYAAVGVYFGLSVLDFPLCFLFVRTLGTERVGEYEEAVLKHIRPHVSAAREAIGLGPSAPPPPPPVGETVSKGRDEKHAVASIWTELALAYAIHKGMFVFVRVPLAVAVTPKVVKTLRSWGWNIGRKKPRAVKEA